MIQEEQGEGKRGRKMERKGRKREIYDKLWWKEDWEVTLS